MCRDREPFKWLFLFYLGHRLPHCNKGTLLQRCHASAEHNIGVHVPHNVNAALQHLVCVCIRLEKAACSRNENGTVVFLLYFLIYNCEWLCKF